MGKSLLFQLHNILTSGVDIEFSVDFNGDVEYVTPHSDENEYVVRYFVESGGIPINERTEGTITTNNEVGLVVDIYYRTCTRVGEDWDSDVWEEGRREVLKLY
jgi:hypothetical protein